MGNELSTAEVGAAATPVNKDAPNHPHHPHHPQLSLAKSLQGFEAQQHPSRTFTHSKSMELDRSSSVGFSDYNFYPDRFNHDLLQKVPEEESREQRQQQHEGMASSDASPTGSPTSNSGVATARFEPALPTISKYNFRIRTFSESTGDLPPPLTAGAAAGNAGHQHRPPPPQRQRSNSLTSSYYYFDFSLMPEKDPRCAKDEEERRRRVRYASQGEDDHHHPQQQQQQPQQQQEPQQQQQQQQPRPKIPRKTSSPPQFSFFDYSMIPDKMGEAKKRDMAVKK